MLPLIVLKRLDAVLEPTKDAVLAAKEKYTAMGLKDEAFEKAISKVAIGSNRRQSLYNLSEFTFQKLLGDSEQQQIITALKSLDSTKLYKSRTEFTIDLDKSAENSCPMSNQRSRNQNFICSLD